MTVPVFRRSLAAAAACAAATAIAFAAAPAAQAVELPDCGPDYSTFAESTYILAAIPEEIPTGVDTDIQLSLDVDTWPTDQEATVNFDAVDGGRIAHPFSQTFSGSDISTTDPNVVTVRMEKGDSPAVLSVTYSTEDASGADPVHCFATVDSPSIKPVAPPDPTPAVTVVGAPGATKGSSQGVGLAFKPSACAAGPLTTTVYGPRWRFAFKTDANCGWPTISVTEPGRVRLSSRPGSPLKITLSPRKAGKIPIRYVTTQGKKVLHSNSFTFETKKKGRKLVTRVTKLKRS